jgi:actin related protein 2/3 complex subunit 1A/1B
VYPSGPQIVIRSPSLPYVSLTFISESQLIAAGHDCQPVVFAGSDGGWALDHSLDDPAAAGAGAKPLTPSATGRVAGPGRLNTEAFNRFRQADSRGASSTSTGSSATKAPGAIATAPDGSLLTVHQNTITSVQPYEWSQNGDVSKVATAGRDGRLVIWNVEAAGLAGGVKNLRM